MVGEVDAGDQKEGPPAGKHRYLVTGQGRRGGVQMKRHHYLLDYFVQSREGGEVHLNEHMSIEGCPSPSNFNPMS
eukprot:1138353-Pelagomonas_calceolata.AAC.1